MGTFFHTPGEPGKPGKLEQDSFIALGPLDSIDSWHDVRINPDISEPITSKIGPAGSGSGQKPQAIRPVPQAISRLNILNPFGRNVNILGLQGPPRSRARARAPPRRARGVAGPSRAGMNCRECGMNCGSWAFDQCSSFQARGLTLLKSSDFLVAGL